MIGGTMTRSREFFAAVLLVVSLIAGHVGAADRFYISIPGPTLSYVPLYFGHEKGFFTQEGLDLQVLVVRGIIGVSSLMSGEIDVTCHAGSVFRRRYAAFRSKSSPSHGSGQ